MKTTTKAAKYLAATDLNASWNLMSKSAKRYARHLVSSYAYPVSLAIQVAYIWGFDRWPYDYRTRCVIRETRDPKDFGWR